MGVLPFVTEDAAALAFHERPIDLVHLARTTLGDPRLQGEMLEAFCLKTRMLIVRMQQAARSSICAAAQASRAGHWRLAHRFGLRDCKSDSPLGHGKSVGGRRPLGALFLFYLKNYIST